MSDIKRLIDLLKKADENTERKCIMDYEDAIKDNAEYLLAEGVVVHPCKVGDKVAVRALCQCVATIPDYDECRNICPFEDDCECEDCDNANERIFNTEISSIFNDGFGWKVAFKNLTFIEANFTDIGTSFFIGEDAEKQAEQKLKEMRGEGK